MSWRSEETISNQTLNDIFAVASTYSGDPRQALHSIAVMASDQANEEHRKYLAYLRAPQGILTTPELSDEEAMRIAHEWKGLFSGPGPFLNMSVGKNPSIVERIRTWWRG